MALSLGLKEINMKRYSHPGILAQYEKKACEGLRKAEKALIKKYFEKGKTLDVGCGSGRTTIALRKGGYDVAGIDISPQMVKLARKISKKEKLGIKFYKMDVCSLKFKDRCFDNILFSFNGFEQIPGAANRLKALKEMHRVLKEKGHLIFTTQSIFAFSNLLEALKQYLFSKEKREFGDCIFFSEGAKIFVHLSNPFKIKKIARSAGFKLLHVNSEREVEAAQNKKLFFFLTRGLVYYVCEK